MNQKFKIYQDENFSGQLKLVENSFSKLIPQVQRQNYSFSEITKSKTPNQSNTNKSRPNPDHKYL